MSENVLYQQLGRFVVLFQRLESSLIEITTLIADHKDYEVVQILLTEIEYRRLVESTDVLFSYFVDLLHQADTDAKARFHSLMNRCSELGTLRNRLIHSTYAHLVKDDNVIALVQEKPKFKFSGGSRREVDTEDLSVDSFDPYFKRITDVLTELESFRLQIIDWKHPDV
jgi:hypothetical protein